MQLPTLLAALAICCCIPNAHAVCVGPVNAPCAVYFGYTIAFGFLVPGPYMQCSAATCCTAKQFGIAASDADCRDVLNVFTPIAPVTGARGEPGVPGAPGPAGPPGPVVPTALVGSASAGLTISSDSVPMLSPDGTSVSTVVVAADGSLGAAIGINVAVTTSLILCAFVVAGFIFRRLFAARHTRVAQLQLQNPRPSERYLSAPQFSAEQRVGETYTSFSAAEANS